MALWYSLLKFIWTVMGCPFYEYGMVYQDNYGRGEKRESSWWYPLCVSIAGWSNGAMNITVLSWVVQFITTLYQVTLGVWWASMNSHSTHPSLPVDDQVTWVYGNHPWMVTLCDPPRVSADDQVTMGVQGSSADDRPMWPPRIIRVMLVILDGFSS